MALITAAALFLLGVLGTAVSRQLNDELKAWIPWIVRRVIQSAIARLPEDQRERFEEEWRSHIDEVPGEIGKIYVALGFVSAAHKMASILNTGSEWTAVTDLLIRTFDLAFSVGSLLFLAPLLLLIALCVRLENAGQVLGAEEVVGLEGRKFKRYRFSTSGRVGKVLHASSLYELPVFLNVLRGDMTVIGPRPEEPRIAEQLSKRIPRYSERTKVKPGLICWALVNHGPLDRDMELDLDLFYIHIRSLKVNWLILTRLLRVFTRDFSKDVRKALIFIFRKVTHN